jgi:signal peptide peptidase SppA
MTDQTENEIICAKKQPQCRFPFMSFLCDLMTKFCDKKPVVTVINLHGEIAHSIGFRSGISFAGMKENIEAAFKASRLQAVALSINSPGGSPVQTELIYKHIRRLSEEKNIKVYAFVEDIAASGGYWLACAGDEIYASNSSIVGSIGVVSAGFGFVEAIKKLGIERRLYFQGENKVILDPFSPENQEDIKILKDIQKDAHHSFKEIVRTRRADKLALTDEELFGGKVWSGKAAQEIGLIDAQGDLYSVIHEKFGKGVKINFLVKNKFWLRKKLGISEQFIESIVDMLLSKISAKIWQRFGL